MVKVRMRMMRIVKMKMMVTNESKDDEDKQGKN